MASQLQEVFSDLERYNMTMQRSAYWAATKIHFSLMFTNMTLAHSPVDSVAVQALRA
jgi:hypothetical protein